MLLFTVENENNVSWQYGYIMEIFRTLFVSWVSPPFLLQILDFTDEKVDRKFRNLLVNMKLVSCSFCLWIRLVTISHFRYVFLLISKATLTSISGLSVPSQCSPGKAEEWGECLQVRPELLNLEVTGYAGDEREARQAAHQCPLLSYSFELEMI